jgi:hypothetical protein
MDSMNPPTCTDAPFNQGDPPPRPTLTSLLEDAYANRDALMGAIVKYNDAPWHVKDPAKKKIFDREKVIVGVNGSWGTWFVDREAGIVKHAHAIGITVDDGTKHGRQLALHDHPEIEVTSLRA